MKEYGCKLDMMIYNILIFGLCVSGKVEKVVVFLE